MNQDNNQNLSGIDQAISMAFEDLSSSEAAASPSFAFPKDDERAAVMAAINQLPERYLICLLLHSYENLSIGEIAEVMQVNEGVVVEMLDKAKRLVAENLQKNGIVLQGSTPIQGKPAVSSAAISQAFVFSEADTLSPRVEEQLSATAADAKLERRSLWSYLKESKIFKAALIIAIIGVICIAGLLVARQFAHLFPWNATSAGTTPSSSQPADSGAQGGSGSSGNGSSQGGDEGAEVTITQPENAETIVIVKGQDIEEYEAFEAEKPNLTFISEDTSEGYRYAIYSKQSSDGTPQYYVIIERISD